MPELPDVETFRQYFESVALHKRIASVDVESDYVLKNTSVRALNGELKGKSFNETHRRGKNLFVDLDNGGCLRIHFGMTGLVQSFKNAKDEPKYTCVRFNFTDGNHLAYADLRQLGEIELVPGALEYAKKQHLGPDAATVSLDQFQKALSDKHGAIKPALIDQSAIAGIGNVYADEILFQCQIHPQQEMSDLSAADIKNLHKVMQKVLSTAVERHADPGNFPRSFLIPRRHKGESCPKCRSKLKSIKVGGRTSWFCPDCQPKR